MAEQGMRAELVTLQELAVSNACQLAAIVAVPEQKDILTQAEGLEQIKRLKAKTPTVR